jgi:hypothetical protein
MAFSFPARLRKRITIWSVMFAALGFFALVRLTPHLGAIVGVRSGPDIARGRRVRGSAWHPDVLPVGQDRADPSPGDRIACSDKPRAVGQATPGRSVTVISANHA